MPQALTGVAQLAGHYPTKQKVTDLIAVRAHAWDGVRSPVRARTRGNRSMSLSLTSMFLSFPSPLSKNNKIFKKKRSLESYLRNPKQICQTRDIKRISGDETASHRYYRHCFCPKNEDCRAQTRLGKKHPANVASHPPPPGLRQCVGGWRSRERLLTSMRESKVCMSLIRC